MTKCSTDRVGSIITCQYKEGHSQGLKGAFQGTVGLFLLLILVGLLEEPAVRQNSGRGQLSSTWNSSMAISPVFATPLAADGNIAFQAGERLTYRISWSKFVEAGTAELTVSQESPPVANSYRLQLKAMTLPALSSMYPFKDEFVSFFDADLGAPTMFEKNFIEKKRTVKETVTFDQINRLATFISSKNQTQKVPIDLGTQDPLSALYLVRSLGLKPGLQILFPIHDGGRNFQVETKVTASDLISTGLGSFNTHRVEASLRREGMLLTNKKITIWFTNDAKKVPVLASVTLPFGTALIELTSNVSYVAVRHGLD